MFAKIFCATIYFNYQIIFLKSFKDDISVKAENDPLLDVLILYQYYNNSKFEP